jgi:hypothetical protein
LWALGLKYETILLINEETKMKLKVIARDSDKCGGRPCPTLYRADDGRVFVQGYIVSPDVLSAAEPPRGETVVEISQKLLDQIIENAASRNK